MTQPQNLLDPIDNALVHIEQAMEELAQIPKQGAQAVSVDGIEHVLRGLVERLRSLRDDVVAHAEQSE